MLLLLLLFLKDPVTWLCINKEFTELQPYMHERELAQQTAARV